MTAITARSEQRCHGGVMGFYSHASKSTATEMRFSVYVPPHAGGERLPVLYYLAGLTCTEETFMIKAGAQQLAAAAGIMLVAPDTSPDRKSTRLNSSHGYISYAVFCLKKKQ